MLLPERELPFCGAAVAHPGGKPCVVVCIADFNWGESRVFPLCSVPVRGRQLGKEDAKGDPVHRAVVQGQQQHMLLLVQAEKPRPQTVITAEVKAYAGFGGKTVSE